MPFQAANSLIRSISQILEVTSPSKEQQVAESSEDSSDPEDDTPLLSLISNHPPQHVRPIRETSPPPPTADLGDYSDGGEIEIPNMRNMINRAMQSLDNITEVCQGNDAAAELRLARTILERLECSFARQEAKLDKILNLMTSVPASSVQHQTSQWVPPLQFSTPDPHISQSLECPVQVQSVQRNAEHLVHPVQIQSLQRTPLADVDMLLNAELTGI